MNQFNSPALNGLLSTLFYLEIIVGIIAFGLFGFVVWLLYTWVISYRDWSRNEINVRRYIGKESIARARKLNAESKIIEHEIETKGLKVSKSDENDMSLTTRHRL